MFFLRGAGVTAILPSIQVCPASYSKAVNLKVFSPAAIKCSVPVDSWLQGFVFYLYSSEKKEEKRRNYITSLGISLTGD